MAVRRRAAERARENAVRARTEQAERQALQEQQRQRSAAAAVSAATSQIEPSLRPTEVPASCTTQSQAPAIPATTSQPQQPAPASDAPAVLDTPLSAATPTTAAVSGVGPAVKPAAGLVSRAQPGDGAPPGPGLGPTSTQWMAFSAGQSSAPSARSTAAASQAAERTMAAASSSSVAALGFTAQARLGADPWPGLGARETQPAVVADAQPSVFGMPAHAPASDTHASQTATTSAPTSLAAAWGHADAQATEERATGAQGSSIRPMTDKQRERQERILRTNAERASRSAEAVEDERQTAIWNANKRRSANNLPVRGAPTPALLPNVLPGMKAPRGRKP